MYATILKAGKWGIPKTSRPVEGWPPIHSQQVAEALRRIGELMRLKPVSPGSAAVVQERVGLDSAASSDRKVRTTGSTSFNGAPLFGAIGLSASRKFQTDSRLIAVAELDAC
jgi:hypothetical protein